MPKKRPAEEPIPAWVRTRPEPLDPPLVPAKGAARTAALRFLGLKPSATDAHAHAAIRRWMDRDDPRFERYYDRFVGTFEPTIRERAFVDPARLEWKLRDLLARCDDQRRALIEEALSQGFNAQIDLLMNDPAFEGAAEVEDIADRRVRYRWTFEQLAARIESFEAHGSKRKRTAAERDAQREKIASILAQHWNVDWSDDPIEIIAGVTGVAPEYLAAHAELRKPRPESEWIRMAAPELRIVPESIAVAIDIRFKREADRYLRTPDGRLQSKPAHNVRYLLSGLARCATCGGGMEVFKRWSDKANVYGCATHRRKGPVICGNAAVIEMGTADAAVLAVVEQALDPELLAAVVDRTAEKLAGQTNRRTQLEAQLADVEAQIRRGTAAILTGGGEVTHLVEALRGLETERQRLERELKARSGTFDRAKLRQALQKHAADWRAMLRRRAQNARAILRKFVAERFVFTPNPAGGYLFRGEGDLGLLLNNLTTR